MENKQYLERFKQYDLAINKAVNYKNDSLTSEALKQQQQAMVSQAKKALRRDLPNPETHAGMAEVQSRKALKQLTPTTTDQIALTKNEWSKVESLLSKGLQLGKVIADADTERLSAIYDQFPTSATATGLTDLDSVTEEINQLALTRLAELGNAQAQQAIEAQGRRQQVSTWHKAIEETCEGELSIQTRGQLHSIIGTQFEDIQTGPAQQASVSRQLKLINLNSYAHGGA